MCHGVAIISSNDMIMITGVDTVVVLSGAIHYFRLSFYDVLFDVGAQVGLRRRCTALVEVDGSAALHARYFIFFPCICSSLEVAPEVSAQQARRDTAVASLRFVPSAKIRPAFEWAIDCGHFLLILLLLLL